MSSFDSFKRLNEVHGSLYEWDFKSLIRSKREFIYNLNTTVLLGDGQFCYDFKGNYVLCKTEQKQTILCLKYKTISSQVKLSFIVIPLHVWTYSGTRCRVSQDHGAT